MEKDKPKVFISYSSADGDFAELLKMKLEQSDITVWRDIYEISPGEEWRNEIDYGLLNSDTIIVILNNNSSKSSYVTYEWAFALGNGKNIIPILVEECVIHSRIKILQYFDFKNQNRPWEKLVDRIKKLDIQNSNTNSNNGELSIEQIFNGIRSLANAKAKKYNRNADSNDIAEATNQMINARNYLNSIENKPETILWVDDQPNNNTYEREAFKTLGFKFDLALSTDEAIKLLKTNKYAAIISDMGRVEGLQEGYVLLKKVRRTDKETPFIIYAGSNLLEHKVIAQEKGAQGSTNRANELVDLVTTHVKNIPSG